MIIRPFTGLQAHPQEALLMNQMIRQGVMFTTGRYGMETDHFPNTGNSFSGIYQNLDSNHFPVKRQLIHLQMIRQTGIFSVM